MDPRRLLALIAGAILLCSGAPHGPRLSAPGLVLWAWERLEDLRFIDPATTGVAYLAATGTIQPDGSISFHFRQQSLATPSGTTRIAVVRIESPLSYVIPDVNHMAEALSAIASQRGASALQIDYDARGSERGFYRALLERLHSTMTMPVGITALASWCESDRWIDPAIVSEAVPMMFRMGRGESKSMTAAAPVCRNSTGVSTDEAWPARLPGRVYVFNPHGWVKSDYESVLKKVSQAR
jgi:hypothetical protein